MFCTFHVLVNNSLGCNTVPDGIVISLINSRLLHPDARDKGLSVAVYCVPAGEGDTLLVVMTGTKTNPCVTDAPCAGRGIDVFVCVVVVGNKV